MLTENNTSSVDDKDGRHDCPHILKATESKQTTKTSTKYKSSILNLLLVEKWNITNKSLGRVQNYLTF